MVEPSNLICLLILYEAVFEEVLPPIIALKTFTIVPGIVEVEDDKALSIPSLIFLNTLLAIPNLFSPVVSLIVLFF